MSGVRWPGFFLVGTGRCGSSLLRRTLRSHPEAYVPQETHWIPILHDFFGRRPITAAEFFGTIRSVYMAKGRTAYQRIQKDSGVAADVLEADVRARVAGHPRPEAAIWMTAFYEALAARHGATAWGDKTPDYGQCMVLLATLWPGARFVHLVRDGRDVALSMTQVRSFRFQVAWGICYWPLVAWDKAYEARALQADGDLPLDGFFELWRRRVLRIRDEAARLPGGACLEVDYDALLENPREVVAAICAHVGLAASADWLASATAEFDAGNAGKNRARPEHRGLTERFGPVLEELGFAP